MGELLMVTVLFHYADSPYLTLSAKFLKIHLEMEWVDLWQLLQLKNSYGWTWGKYM